MALQLRVRGMGEGRYVQELPRALLREVRGSSNRVRVVGQCQPLFALQRYRLADATSPLRLQRGRAPLLTQAPLSSLSFEREDQGR